MRVWNTYTSRTYTGETFVDLTQVAAFLHRDEAEMIFLVQPSEEGLLLVVENTSARVPAAVAASISQNPATIHTLFSRRRNIPVGTLQWFRCCPSVYPSKQLDSELVESSASCRKVGAISRVICF